MRRTCGGSGLSKVAPWLLAFKVGAVSTAFAAPPAGPADARGSLALYCPTECGEIQLGSFSMRARLPATANAAVMSVVDASEGARPDAAALQTWGEGELSGMSEATQVVVLSWAAPKDQGAKALAEALRIGAEAGTWIEDVDTGRYFDQASALTMAEQAEAAAIDLSRLTVVEVHQAGTALAILSTRGLARLGLPDLVEVGVPADQVDASGARLNAIAQAMWEQGAARNGPVSVMEVDAARFANEDARRAACQLKGTANLAYDRGNRAILGGGVRASVERFNGAFGECEGASAAAPSPTESLATVRAQAISRLRTEIRAAWTVGLPAGERLMVKAPFQSPDGQVEWLWLQVERWEANDVLKGKLLSAPNTVPDVKKGDSVQAPLDLVFDWIWVRADGRSEGNETQKWL